MKQIYHILSKHYGEQIWWPISNSFTPKHFEVCIGAILTQNTNWKNVEKALENLKKEGLTTPQRIKNCDSKKLENVIKPSGFYKQKAERLKVFSAFFLNEKKITREKLLSLKGIGPETADSILLYALNKKYFPVDAYTRRIFSRLGILNGKEKYEEIRNLFEKSLPKSVRVYKNFHAFIVEHAKRFCKKVPVCEKCPLRDVCKKP